MGRSESLGCPQPGELEMVSMRGWRGASDPLDVIPLQMQPWCCTGGPRHRGHMDWVLPPGLPGEGQCSNICHSPACPQAGMSLLWGLHSLGVPCHPPRNVWLVQGGRECAQSPRDPSQRRVRHPGLGPPASTQRFLLAAKHLSRERGGEFIYF